MRKYTLVIVLALCLVVGGVFATWTYADAAIDPANSTEASFAIESKSTGQVAIGTLIPNGSVSFSLDQNAPGDWSAKLVNGTGQITVGYQANQDAASDATPTIKWKLEGKLVVNSNDIVTVTNPDATYTYNSAPITAADIASKLTVTLTLSSASAYDTFAENFLNNKQSTLKVVFFVE